MLRVVFIVVVIKTVSCGRPQRQTSDYEEDEYGQIPASVSNGPGYQVVEENPEGYGFETQYYPLRRYPNNYAGRVVVRNPLISGGAELNNRLYIPNRFGNNVGYSNERDINEGGQRKLINKQRGLTGNQRQVYYQNPERQFRHYSAGPRETSDQFNSRALNDYEDNNYLERQARFRQPNRNFDREMPYNQPAYHDAEPERVVQNNPNIFIRPQLYVRQNAPYGQLENLYGRSYYRNGQIEPILAQNEQTFKDSQDNIINYKYPTADVRYGSGGDIKDVINNGRTGNRPTAGINVGGGRFVETGNNLLLYKYPTTDIRYAAGQGINPLKNGLNEQNVYTQPTTGLTQDGRIYSDNSVYEGNRYNHPIANIRYGSGQELNRISNYAPSAINYANNMRNVDDRYIIPAESVHTYAPNKVYPVNYYPSSYLQQNDIVSAYPIVYQSYSPAHQYGYGGENIDKLYYNDGKKNLNDKSYTNLSEKKNIEAATGEEGTSGHTAVLQHRKQDKGHYQNDVGGKTIAEDAKSYGGTQHYNQKGKAAEEMNKKSTYRKGHVIKSFKNSHHKDETKEEEEYYDEAHDEADNVDVKQNSAEFGDHNSAAYKGGRQKNEYAANEKKNQGHHNLEEVVNRDSRDKNSFDLKKYSKNSEQRGSSIGHDQQSLLGHQEFKNLYKHRPYFVPFYRYS